MTSSGPMAAGTAVHPQIPCREAYFTCRDHLSLFYREFGDPRSDATAMLCLPGLTRNSKDFIDLAQRVAGQRRVICPDLRGRGRSEPDPDYRRYHPATYVADVWELLERLGLYSVIVIGTSLGGLMAMMMAAARPQAVAGVVLNDIGPEVAPAGLARISAYVGNLPQPRDWWEAVAQAREVYELALPDLSDRQWLTFTRRQYSEDKQGTIRLDYDPRIGDALREVGGTPGEPWTLFRALAEVPALALRGELSDILSEETFARMAREKPDLAGISIPNRGHVPLLNEPRCIAAIDTFLAGL